MSPAFENLLGPLLLGSAGLLAILLAGPFGRWCRVRRHTRGKRRSRPRKNYFSAKERPLLQFGNELLPTSALNDHLLFAGTSGSGKSLLQRRLLKNFLRDIKPGSDSRCLILDAKNDIVPYLQQIGVTCDVWSVDPFETRNQFPMAAAWDVAADVTTPSEAMNFAAGIFPEEKDGTNRFWTDSARLVVAAVIESFLRHTPLDWRFSDLVYGTLDFKRMTTVLSRDQHGQETLENFFFDEDVAYKIFATIASRMTYYRPVAALWQRLPADRKLSVRDWLEAESILLLGVNATSRKALEVINELLFRTVVQEVDMLPNSSHRKIVIWLDEARLAGSLLRRDLLPYFAVKSRSKGGSLVLSFQDIEGFRDACGSERVANEIVAQCSYKWLGRFESEESARWASGLCGQYLTREWYRTEKGRIWSSPTNYSEQRLQEVEVLPAEFFNLPPPSKRHGVTGVFLSPQYGRIETVSGVELAAVATDDCTKIENHQPQIPRRQLLTGWSDDDRRRLLLVNDTAESVRGYRKLRLKRAFRE